MSGIQRTALFIAIIGALNWALIGLFEFDVVGTMFGGQNNLLAQIVYSLIGLAGIINLGLLFKPTIEFRRPVARPVQR